MVGKLKVFPVDVWYQSNGNSNILSMAEVENYFPVTYGKGKYFVIPKADGTKSRFVKYPWRVYYLDTNESRNDSTQKYQ